jgi:hypothetical protein
MASKLPVRLPTFDKRIIDDLALLAKLSAENLKPIAEVAVQLIVSNAGDGEIAELAGDMADVFFQIKTEHANVFQKFDADVLFLLFYYPASLQSRAEKIKPIVHGLSSAFWECAKVWQTKEPYRIYLSILKAVFYFRCLFF